MLIVNRDTTGDYTHHTFRKTFLGLCEINTHFLYTHTLCYGQVNSEPSDAKDTERRTKEAHKKMFLSNTYTR